MDAVGRAKQDARAENRSDRDVHEDSSTALTRLSRNRDIFTKAALAAIVTLGLAACTQETQNKFGRAVQNWTGTDGILEVYAGDKLVKRFLEIDKLSTALGTSDGVPRSYRFGYGILDTNLNGVVDKGEKKVYFEFSDYSTSYIFHDNPN